MEEQTETRLSKAGRGGIQHFLHVLQGQGCMRKRLLKERVATVAAVEEGRQVRASSWRDEERDHKMQLLSDGENTNPKVAREWEAGRQWIDMRWGCVCAINLSRSTRGLVPRRKHRVAPRMEGERRIKPNGVAWSPKEPDR